MRTIKRAPQEKEKHKTCWKCKTQFSYVQADKKTDRDGTYVECPNEDCKAFIAVK